MKPLFVDWQHIALLVVALAAAAVQIWRPQLSTYTGPLLAVLVSGGILKYSPLLGPGAKDDSGAPKS